ncbi:hypothetical protein CYY_002486 [Polysphondylium violaceum]|uniref:Ubiquitin-like protease family profile domain-containing protein n=1 Tax=Polysphondylium violaceum TaxID=133409 RepID=A0A8J4UV30_9MYCE|nr:hypothetical protein CYY_002486 [Polysphondylium violaceum]
MTRKRTRGASPHDQPLKVSKLNFSDSLIEQIIDDNKGTHENPLNLDEDDDDIVDVTPTTNGNGKSTTTTTTTTATATPTTEQSTTSTVDILKIMESIKQDNIYLKPNLIAFGSNNPIRSTKPVVFNETEIEFEISLKALQPYQSKSDDVVVIIRYKDISKFSVSFRNSQTDIEINVKEFTFKKGWLKKVSELRSYEAGIPHDIYLRSISKDEFTLMRPQIGLRSEFLNVIINVEDKNASNKTIIARYPHRASSSKCEDITRDVINITSDDLSRLEPFQYLNDSIVDFYIRYIKDKYVDAKDSSRFHFFNTYFYNILTTQSKIEDAYTKISKWTKNTDIFSKDFIFIPICENFHWTLVIVAFAYLDSDKQSSSQKSVILYLDSLHSGLGKITNKIREYLSLEWENKKSKPSNGEIPEKKFNFKNLPLYRCSVPKQNNLCDCGVFLLHYIELFCRNPEKNFDDPLNKPQWFPISEIEQKRESIKTIIKVLALEQDSERQEGDTDSSDSDSDDEKEKEKEEKKVDTENNNNNNQEVNDKMDIEKEKSLDSKKNDLDTSVDEKNENDKSLEIIEKEEKKENENDNDKSLEIIEKEEKSSTVNSNNNNSEKQNENDKSVEIIENNENDKSVEIVENHENEKGTKVEESLLPSSLPLTTNTNDDNEKETKVEESLSPPTINNEKENDKGIKINVNNQDDKSLEIVEKETKVERSSSPTINTKSDNEKEDDMIQINNQNNKSMEIVNSNNKKEEEEAFKSKEEKDLNPQENSNINDISNNKDSNINSFIEKVNQDETTYGFSNSKWL